MFEVPLFVLLFSIKKGKALSFGVPLFTVTTVLDRQSIREMTDLKSAKFEACGFATKKQRIFG